jgi:hypothetical protein
MKTYKFITTITIKWFFYNKVQDVCDIFEAESLEEARKQYEAKKIRTIIMDIPSNYKNDVIFSLKDISII